MLAVAFILLSIALLVASAYGSARWGWIVPVSAGAASAAMIGFSVIDPVHAGEIVSPVVIGSVAGCSLKYKKSKQFFLIVSACALTALFSASYYSLKWYRNTDILVESKKMFQEMIATSSIPDAERKELMERFDEFTETAREAIPFIHFMYGIVLSAAGLAIIRIALRTLFADADAINRGLEYFLLNDYAIFALIAGWFVVLLADPKDLALAHHAGLNGALIASLLYVLQALGVIKFFLMKKGIPVFLLPLTLFIIMIAGIPFVLFFMIMLVSFGALDLWADFRKLRARSAR